MYGLHRVKNKRLKITPSTYNVHQLYYIIYTRKSSGHELFCRLLRAAVVTAVNRIVQTEFYRDDKILYTRRFLGISQKGITGLW